MSQPEQREEVVFEAALRLAADQRAAYLDQTCAGDPETRRRVEALLGAFERAGGFLKDPAVATAARTVAVSLPPTEKPGDRIGRYKLLEQIGEGGCGVVYVAEQEEPVRRRVALKVIKLGMDTKQVIARFDAERQALALMDHPNIAKIHDAGVTDTGRPYFIMELVRGIKITDYCDQNRLSPRERLDLFTPVCRAIQHAHQKGIIHRDIKPSNILVTLHDGVPVPKVIDFGIAKATQGRLTDQTVYTAFEQFIGTPAYMSPEQAEMSGLDIDTRSDIYSLGVLLYELLTGKTPFDAKELLAAGLDEMRRTIREVEPIKPSTRLTQERLANRPPDSAKSALRDPKSEIDNDLDWIVMKCLEKDRTRRYETANGLATDINRHLNNEPIIARPPGNLYRFQKLVRRNKLAFTAAAAVSTMLVLGVVVSTWQAIRATRAEREQSRLRQQAERSESTAKRQEQLARESADEARRQQHLASEQELLARRRFYAAQMNLANQAWETGRLPRTMDLLETQRPLPGQTDLRSFEWFHLWGLCNERNRFTLSGHSGDVKCVAFSPDGNTLASGGEDGTIRLWNIATGHEKIAIKLDSSYPVINALVFTPDGKTLASGSWDKLIRLWDVPSGKVRTTLSGHPGFVRCLAVSPDGKMLASGGDGGAVKLWDLATGKLAFELEAHQGVVSCMAFSSDNTTLATGSDWGEPERGIVVLWSLSDKPHPIWKIAQKTMRLAFSPDNQTLAVAGWDRIHLLDTSNGQPRGTLTGHLPRVNSVAFLRDGKTLVSCASDRTIRFWPWSEKQSSNVASRIIGGHLGVVSCLAVAPDGALLASGASDGSVKLWKTAEAKSSLFTMFKFGDRPDGWNGLAGLQPSPRGNVVFVVTRNGTEVRDFATMRKQRLWPDAIGMAALSRDGRLLATGSQSGLVKLWEADTGRLLASVQAHTNTAFASGVYELLSIAFSPDGRILATADYEEDTRVRLWDTEAALKPVHSLATPGIGVSALEFSPDGKRLAVGVRQSKLLLFDVSSGSLNRTIIFANGAAEAWATAFSPDGKLLAVCGHLEDPVLWDVESGQPRFALGGNEGGAHSIMFSPNGATVATGGDSNVRLWDVATGQERITFKVEDRVVRVAFSRDGNTLFGASSDGTVRLWRAYHVDDANKSALGMENLVESQLSEGQYPSLVRRGAWKEAAADLAIILESKPGQHQFWYEQAALLVQAGDLEAYRKHRQAMLSKFQGTDDPSTARPIVRACLLLPASDEELDMIGRLADSVLGQQHAWMELSKGMAEFRQGRFASAVEWMKKALVRPLNDRRDAAAWMVLAMAHHQLKQPDEARVAFAKGKEIIGTRLPKLDSGDLGPTWGDILITHILMREAKALIEVQVNTRLEKKTESP